MLTYKQLNDARLDGAGYCLFCGEREDDLPSPYTNECSNCGHPTVIPATMILTLLAWIKQGDSDES
jgi:hypothetical protein